jgi:hypothetical protein
MIRILTVCSGILTLLLAVGLATSPGQAVLGLSSNGPRVVPIRDTASAAAARTHSVGRHAAGVVPAHAGTRAPGARMHAAPRATPARPRTVPHLTLLMNLQHVLARAFGHPRQGRDEESP